MHENGINRLIFLNGAQSDAAPNHTPLRINGAQSSGAQSDAAPNLNGAQSSDYRSTKKRQLALELKKNLNLNSCLVLAKPTCFQ